MPNNSLKQINQPLWLALALAIGILIGAQFVDHPLTTKSSVTGVERLQEVLLSIEKNYVDSVNINHLVESGIEGMLETLDPHTAYIPARDLNEINAQLKGHYDGIGIEFDIINDSITVIRPSKNGPSEEAGIQIGDRIIKVNDENVAGIGITSKGVTERLLGKKDSRVSVAIFRPTTKQTYTYTITRRSIYQNTVVASYIINDSTGYIKLSRFGTSSAMEVKDALTDLLKNGINQLIFDLQGNPGGYLDAAEKIADEFLPEGSLVVSQKGKSGIYDSEFRATADGAFENQPLIVLIDEYSASASEILAGALQDNDRALIVGRRSFGKGLVQMPIGLSDGAELRLTIARYFTASGRSIQKSYEKGNKEYAHDLNDRYAHGEFYHADSITFNDSLRYTTSSGRTVYGGGGIMPDYFVALDSTQSGPLYAKLQNKNVLRQWVISYVGKNQNELEKIGQNEFLTNKFWQPKYTLELQKWATKNSIAFTPSEFTESKLFIETYCKAEVAHLVWGESLYFQILNPVLNLPFQKSLSLVPQSTSLLKN